MALVGGGFPIRAVVSKADKKEGSHRHPARGQQRVWTSHLRKTPWKALEDGQLLFHVQFKALV